MARPTKLGLEYFSLDVDIFEDEKVIPVSSAFGPKGECIIIRVLCAIYRNGYFAECSEAFKFKIAKQANLPESLVSEVIAGLVKWGFFDKAVFDSFGVLTSTGIQKRWKDATRKRVLKSELDYWILGVNDKNMEFPAEETPLNRSETPQSKVKKSKVKENNNIAVNEDVFERIEQRKERPISQCMDMFLKDENHMNLISMNLGFKDITEAKGQVIEFFKAIQLRGEQKKSLIDSKSHFINWYNKRNYGGKSEEKHVYEA